MGREGFYLKFALTSRCNFSPKHVVLLVCFADTMKDPNVQLPLIGKAGRVCVRTGGMKHVAGPAAEKLRQKLSSPVL